MPKIEKIVFGEAVAWDDARKAFDVTGEVHQSVSLLNPSSEVIVDWQVGYLVTGLAPGASVVAKFEVCHEDVGKWIAYPELQESMGPTDTYWVHVTTMNFPAGRHGTYKFRLTIKTDAGSVRLVRKVLVRHTPTRFGAA